MTPMNIDLLLTNFDRLIDSPEALPKLRELILDLAVRGKLVPQDPREDLEQNNKRSFRKISDVPKNWITGKLGDFLIFEYGKNLPAGKRTEGGNIPVYGSNGVVGKHSDFLTKEPSIIIGRKGSAGAVNLAKGPSWTTDVAYYVCPPNGLDVQFTFYLLRALKLDKMGKGIKPGLSRKEAYEIQIALPPLAEQRRIVARVDELMAQCDRLEAQLRQRDTHQTNLATAAIARFTADPTPANLEYLFHDSFDISPADLRKVILTLAFTGKLVKENSTVESSGYFIDGTSRLVTDLSKLNDCKLKTPHYSLPFNWRWVFFGEIANIATNLVDPLKFQKLMHVAPDNIVKHKGLLLSCNTVEDDDVRSGNHRFFSGQILYSKIRPNLCKVVLVDFEGLCSADMYPIWSKIDSKYLVYYMLSDHFLIQAVKSDTRVAMPKINQEELRSILVPLPPLAEQKRIAKLVEKLFITCDHIENILEKSKESIANINMGFIY